MPWPHALSRHAQQKSLRPRLPRVWRRRAVAFSPRLSCPMSGIYIQRRAQPLPLMITAFAQRILPLCSRAESTLISSIFLCRLLQVSTKNWPASGFKARELCATETASSRTVYQKISCCGYSVIIPLVLRSRPPVFCDLARHTAASCILSSYP